MLSSLVAAVAATASLAMPGAAPAPCTDLPDLPNALCGSVTVPLDRADPASPTTKVAYVLMQRKDTSVPSEGTLMLNPGGPGEDAYQYAGFLTQQFAALFDRRDLLLIDPRGTGHSDPLSCRAFDDVAVHFAPRASYIAATGACGRELGARARHYGSVTVADDYDAVRAALGVEKVDFWGDSYGTNLATVYAARHGDHLRSIVLSGAYPPDFDPYGRDQLAAGKRAIGLVCARTKACRADAVMEDLAAVASRLRRDPVRFTVLAGARRFRVTLDEELLARLFYIGRYPERYGLVPAALAAGRDGDFAPLRRMAEDFMLGFASNFSGIAQPHHSLAMDQATRCHDYPRTYDYADSPAVRRATYARALSAIDPGEFAPFSPAAWTHASLEAADACIAWPNDPTAASPLPADARLPDVPVLVLSGDLDANTPTPAGRKLAEQFPRATHVEIPNAGHTPTLDPCAATLGLRFVATLTVDANACAGAGTPPPVAPRAATRAADLRLVSTSAPRLHRRTLQVVAATAADLSARAPFLASWPAVGGLRGGRYTARRDGSVALTRVRVVNDATVTGVLTATESSTTGTVRLAGPGVAPGRLRVSLTAKGRGHAEGNLDGQRVDLAFRLSTSG